MSEGFTKDSLVETVFSKIKFRLQQKSHQAATPSKFFCLVYCYRTQEISINAQANLSSFWTRNSLTSIDSKSGNDGTDEHEGRIFGEYPNDEEESSQIETDMAS